VEAHPQDPREDLPRRAPVVLAPLMGEVALGVAVRDELPSRRKSSIYTSFGTSSKYDTRGRRSADLPQRLRPEHPFEGAPARFGEAVEGEASRSAFPDLDAHAAVFADGVPGQEVRD
jgi:hypothetical protein